LSHENLLFLNLGLNILYGTKCKRKASVMNLRFYRKMFLQLFEVNSAKANSTTRMEWNRCFLLETAVIIPSTKLKRKKGSRLPFCNFLEQMDQKLNRPLLASIYTFQEHGGDEIIFGSVLPKRSLAS
jgi:hypothetical protein